MKILFLARRFWPDQGGVEKHVLELSRRLIEKGHKVTVLTESQGDSNEVDGINIVRLPLFREGKAKKFKIWKWMLQNFRLFADNKIVHAHDVYFWYWPIKLLFPSKKSYITFHGYETYPISWKAILVRKISEKMADGNIIVGDFIAKWYRTKPDIVTYGAVDMVKPQKPKRLDSAVFIGRLDEHTGILDYAKAVEIIKDSYKSFKFTVLGDGKYKTKLNGFKTYGFKENVTDYLKENNFAFVSRYLSILEALASKRLVFALYDNPVKEDYLKMAPFASFIVTADKPETLARKVKYFLTNSKETKKFTEKGFEWVKDQSWEKLVSDYLRLWRKNI
jgi:glycosyltransferase involved in cell wall biosynthesis